MNFNSALLKRTSPLFNVMPSPYDNLLSIQSLSNQIQKVVVAICLLSKAQKCVYTRDKQYTRQTSRGIQRTTKAEGKANFCCFTISSLQFNQWIVCEEEIRNFFVHSIPFSIARFICQFDFIPTSFTTRSGPIPLPFTSFRFKFPNLQPPVMQISLWRFYGKLPLWHRLSQLFFCSLPNQASFPLEAA